MINIPKIIKIVVFVYQLYLCIRIFIFCVTEIILIENKEKLNIKEQIQFKDIFMNEKRTINDVLAFIIIWFLKELLILFN